MLHIRYYYYIDGLPSGGYSLSNLWQQVSIDLLIVSIIGFSMCYIMCGTLLASYIFKDYIDTSSGDTVDR